MNKFSEDRIGLIVFAGDAFVQLPITSDYVSAKMFLDNINPSLIETQGTDIGKALQLSMNSFTPNSKVGKAIILITDGEDNEGGAEEMAKQAQSKGIKVFILGIGSKEGATIPMPDGGLLKTSTGDVVKTHLNEDMCKQMLTQVMAYIFMLIIVVLPMLCWVENSINFKKEKSIILLIAISMSNFKH